MCALVLAHTLQGERTRVFILAGQSNMQGCGVVERDHQKHYNGDKGNLLWAMTHSESRDQMSHLKNDSGFWTRRADVSISYKQKDQIRKGPLTIGYTGFDGSSHFGPELQFGHRIGDAMTEPVLLIKTAWGGKSLMNDFRPPSAGGTVGPYYQQMLAEIHEALDALQTPYELSAFIWMQGWNDMTDEAARGEYASNLQHLAKDVRTDLGAPELPFIVGELGNGGHDASRNMRLFREAQRSGTEGITNSIFVETHTFARPAEDSPNTGHLHHWCGNAESYFLIGDALAEGALQLIDPASEGNFRTFTDISGKQIEARILATHDASVDLEKRDGHIYEAVSLDRFSRADQNYVRRIHALSEKAAPSFKIKKGQIFGYGHIRTNKVDKAIYGGGYTMYSAVWPLVETYPGNRFQTGLLHTWMFAQYDPSIDTQDMYSCIEGGLGWWRDTRFATETPKFIMGGVALKFSEWANGPGAGKGRDWDQPKGKYAIAQLSSRVLWPPDGLNLKQGMSGELFGYGYRPLPLIEPKANTYGSPVPTGGQCWTLFINTQNVKGPLTFFLPEFFARPTIEERKMAGQFLDSRPSNPDRSLSMETQYIPAFVAESDSGEVYARIAPVLYPKTHDATPLAHQVQSYPRAPLWEAVEAWFSDGIAAPSSVFSQGAAFQTFKGASGSSWSIYAQDTPKEERRSIDWDVFMKARAFDEVTFGYQWNADYVEQQAYRNTTAYRLPEFYRLRPHRKTQIWEPVWESDIPEGTGLRRVTFPATKKRILDPYVTPDTPDSVWKSPGPVSGPHSAYPGDGSVVTYYWYRFADQPAIQKSALTPAEREELQRRVELIHREWTLDQSFIAEPSIETALAQIDPALVVEPPEGFEIGYVPIVTQQAWASPPE
jgi:hypothetical protein